MVTFTLAGFGAAPVVQRQDSLKSAHILDEPIHLFIFIMQNKPSVQVWVPLVRIIARHECHLGRLEAPMLRDIFKGE